MKSREQSSSTEFRKRSSETLFDKAAKKKGITGENLLIMLEKRLDNVVFRMGLSLLRKRSKTAGSTQPLHW